VLPWPPDRHRVPLHKTAERSKEKDTKGNITEFLPDNLHCGPSMSTNERSRAPLNLGLRTGYMRRDHPDQLTTFYTSTPKTVHNSTFYCLTILVCAFLYVRSFKHRCRETRGTNYFPLDTE
jgi:hypothetical protein